MHRRRAPTPPTSDPARLGAPMHPTRAPTPPTSGTAHVGGTSAQQTCTYAPNFRRHPTLGRAVHHIDRCVYRSEEHTSELQSLMRIPYAVFCLKKKTIPI